LIFLTSVLFCFQTPSSVFKPDVGGFVGLCSMHGDLIGEASTRMEDSCMQGIIMVE
jgi:fructose 1,6-bisphosphatase